MAPADRELTEFVVQLRNKEEIKDALLRYCRGVDRRDMDLVRSAYHSDAFDDHGSYKGDVDGLVDWLDRRHDGIDQSMHVLGNCVIELNGAVAVAETYATTFQQFGPEAHASTSRYLPDEYTRADAPVLLTISSRYIDRFELRDAAWRISYRTVVMEAFRWEMGDPALAVTGDWVRANRDSNDPLWSIRRAAGIT